MIFANRISSSTSCSIWPPETSPPRFRSGRPPSPFSKLQHFQQELSPGARVSVRFTTVYVDLRFTPDEVFVRERLSRHGRPCANRFLQLPEQTRCQLQSPCARSRLDR